MTNSKAPAITELLTVSCPVIAPTNTVAVAVEDTHSACVPSLQSPSSVVHTEAAITSNAILMAWKLY
jgi:phosphohistidine swiveling domain-containing protein